jgi:calcineurin-like phosphoesterase family protein
MKRWFKRKPAPQSPTAFPPPAPETPFYAIGDVHGRLDLVEKLLARLDPAHPVVFVGDYVDRGENSADVLRYLRTLNSHPDRRVICLKGNHEDMLLSFLNNPERRGRNWLRNGGLQTLGSFGVAGLSEASAGQALADAATALQQAMGNELINWLKRLHLFWSSGNLTVAHAGADPTKPIGDQPMQNLIWGHPDFCSVSRQDGMWLVHGHTIVDAPLTRNGVVSIDTGAYATGRLTAAFIENGSISFLST